MGGFDRLCNEPGLDSINLAATQKLFEWKQFTRKRSKRSKVFHER